MHPAAPPTVPQSLPPEDAALLALGRALRAAGYAFTTITPASHARVLARPGAARTLRDVFGWSRPYAEGVVPAELDALLERAGMRERTPEGLLRSRVRFSTLGSALYLHDAFPTEAEDAVFFGPDTYRFAALLARLPGRFTRGVDVGCGSGAGLLSMVGRVARHVLSDVSPRALRFARINAELAGVGPDCVELARGDVLSGVQGALDLIVANPPYLVDEQGRTYRHGGEGLGVELAVRIVREGLARLSPGGTLVLYTGTPVVDGEDVLLRELREDLARSGRPHTYEELDPDVFGEELEREAYARVDRIALVALVLGAR